MTAMRTLLEEHLLKEISEVECENERLREEHRHLKNENCFLKNKDYQNRERITDFKRKCNEITGDYYRTVNKLVHEKAMLRSKIHDILFYNQTSISDGLYLEMMNLLKDWNMKNI